MIHGSSGVNRRFLAGSIDALLAAGTLLTPSGTLLLMDRPPWAPCWAVGRLVFMVTFRWVLKNGQGTRTPGHRAMGTGHPPQGNRTS